MKTQRSRAFIAAAITTWALLLMVGFGTLIAYSDAPGEAAVAPRAWPAASQLKRTSGRGMLLVFLHPLCPCSDATLAELERILPFSADKVDHYAVFSVPGDKSDRWAEGDLWEKAKRIPGLRVVLDRGYRETDLFGAKTSGQSLLFGADGNLQFAGGITPARGHQGDSYGRSAVLDILEGRAPSRLTTPVFGCALKSALRSLASVKNGAGL
jgi:hypothetical protein